MAHKQVEMMGIISDLADTVEVLRSDWLEVIESSEHWYANKRKTDIARLDQYFRDVEHDNDPNHGWFLNKGSQFCRFLGFSTTTLIRAGVPHGVLREAGWAAD